MRGLNPPGMMNSRKGERGWATRQAEALSKMQGNASWRAIDAERQAAYAERERLALEDVERRRAETSRLRVTCPCCGAGAVSVERAELILAALDKAPVNDDRRLETIRNKDTRPCPVCDTGRPDAEMAERVVEALSRLPANRDVDCLRIGNLIATAKGEQFYAADAIRPRNGAHRPRRAAPGTDAVLPPAADPASPLVVETRPARPVVNLPFLEDDDDGALT